MRRSILAALISLSALLAWPVLAQTTNSQSGWKALRASGAIVLFRHANAPGVGDPEGMKIGDCSTQRNLDETGREQARQIGKLFKTQGISVRQVFSSQWCRARDTARLAFPHVPTTDAPAFNSFSNNATPSPSKQRQPANSSWLGKGQGHWWYSPIRSTSRRLLA